MSSSSQIYGDFSGQARGSSSLSPRLYFCHVCNQTVHIVPSTDVVCSLCNGGFVEEYENPNPNPLSDGGLIDLSSLFQRPRDDPTAFDPIVFFQNYLQTLRAAGGSNFQFVIENNSSNSSPFDLPSNLGDYFVGPGFEQLIQQLAENDPNRHGPPPASKSSIDALPDVKFTEDLLDSDYSQCAVCKDSFEIGSEAKQMPCKHIYHSECILPWLELHNSCPVCRYELPTDDPDYENKNTTREDSSPFFMGGENVETPRTAERSVRISLPWNFRPFGFPSEASNSDNSEDPGSNNAGRRNQDFGPEDLD